MSRKIYLLLVSAVVLAVGGGLYYKGAEATPAAPPAAIERVGQPVDVNRCYACHAQIKDFHADGKHATVNCISCHTELDRHLKRYEI